MRVVTLSLCLLLAGCGSKPITAHEVLFSNADTIKVQWDEILSSEANAHAIAQQHCGTRAMEVIDAGADAALFGMVKTKTWRCIGPGANPRP